MSVTGIVYRTTCFSLLGGHHQVQQVLAIGDSILLCYTHNGDASTQEKIYTGIRIHLPVPVAARSRA